MVGRRAQWAWGLVLLAGGATAEPPPPSDVPMDREIDDAVALIQQRYLQEMSREEILARALQALMSDLDAYSRYLTPAERRYFEGELAARFGGLGLNLGFEDGTGVPYVRFLMVESPGARAGLRRGDRLVSVAGHATRGETPDAIIDWMRGEPGTPVDLGVARAGSDTPLRLTATREAIALPSVRGHRRDAAGKPQFLLDAGRGIGYIRIQRLADDTLPAVESALASMESDGLRGLVLDLRDCVGGKMDAALAVADLFIDHGRLLTVVERDKTTHHEATPGVASAVPLVVLVNGGTVSSGEILAAALQDTGGATLVGQRTFGKGRIQAHIPLGEGRGSLVLSTGTFQRPSGMTIDRHDTVDGEGQAGIAPDIEVALDDAEQRAWSEHASLLDAAVLLTDDEQAFPVPDRGLARALEVLRARGAEPAP